MQLTYDEAELLTSHDYEEPLIAGGIRCHGGFDADGTYVSPRTKVRTPAIAAWQDNHRAGFGTDLLDLPLDTWPGHYPNVTQARFLIESGLPKPIINTLTRIGTVEGFGGMIRLSPVPDRRRTFAEDTDGTALAHLTTGLFEAHARDEAGFDPEVGEPEGGHKQMWFAARDVAFGHPPTDDETNLMLQRMGIGQMAKATERFWPEDVSVDLELLAERMTRLLLIEISAFHTFAWAEELLDDPDLVAGDREAARLVSYIRADETPHVEYLKTVLTEMRDRTIVGDTGRRHAGTDLVGRIWDRAVGESLGERRRLTVEIIRGEVAHAAEGRSDAADLLARFDDLATLEEATAA